MFFNNGGESSKRKRVADEENISLAGFLNKPFTSYTSLLVGDDDTNGCPFTGGQRDPFDEIIKTHNESLRRTLAEARKAEFSMIQKEAEEAGSRAKELETELKKVLCVNAELAQRALHFEKHVEYLQCKVQVLETLRKKLRKQMEDAKQHQKCRRCAAEMEEDGESSSNVDAEKKSGEETPRWLACKGCGKRVGNFMFLPCRHVSACIRCEKNMVVCPVCHYSQSCCC